MRLAPNCSIIVLVKHLAIYGVCGGLLIVAMRFVEYRFLVVEHSVEINAAVTFTEPFPIGLLVTLISAAVLRKKTA